MSEWTITDTQINIDELEPDQLRLRAFDKRNKNNFEIQYEKKKFYVTKFVCDDRSMIVKC